MPRSYSMTSRAAAAATVRDRILEAALDEIAGTGESLTLQNVAARADVALRTLYNHFPSREALLSAAFARHWDQTRAAVEAIAVPDAAPPDQLRHAVAAYYARYTTMGERLRVLLSLRGVPELDDQIRAIREWRRQVLRQIIRRAKRAGVLAIPEANALALAFTMTSHTTWSALVEELRGDAAKAIALAGDSLEVALFNRDQRSSNGRRAEPRRR
jgi:AcrR family transcriptional regulator